jgi:hypothetical protein
MFPDYSMVTSIAASLLKAWIDRRVGSRATLIAAFVIYILAAILASTAQFFVQDHLQPILVNAAVACAVLASVLVLGVLAYQNILDERERKQQVQEVEEKVRENPKKPQLAWDLARTKLENYLDRNLGQLRSIYWLTLLVMICGFAFVTYGLLEASQHPDKLPVSMIASTSGVLISFIGGSFLVIYRSVLAQSKEYVTVLERINAVGMAVQVISNIPDENSELKHSTTADLAKQLLAMYTVKIESPKRTK